MIVPLTWKGRQPGWHDLYRSQPAVLLHRSRERPLVQLLAIRSWSVRSNQCRAYPFLDNNRISWFLLLKSSIGKCIMDRLTIIQGHDSQKTANLLDKDPITDAAIWLYF